MKDLLIAQVPLLASLPAAELERLSRVLVLRTYAAGSVLFREGERGQSLFSIVSGQAQVVKALGSEDERIVGVSGPGDFVGEMSLLSPDSLRTASVLCVGELEALELPRAEFDSLLQRFPSVGLQLISVLGRRLDATNNATIHDLHEKNRAITLSHAELSVAHARLKRTRHFAIMLLSVLLLIVGVVAALLAYYQFSVRSALDTPSDLLLIMAELGRNINVPAEAAALKNPQPLSSEVVVNARRAYTGCAAAVTARMGRAIPRSARISSRARPT